MLVHRNLDNLPQFNKAVLTIGTFDGVHTGHQQIINLLTEEARKIRGETVLITFDPHPRRVLDPNKSLKLINTLNEKISLLDDQGIDHLVIVPFTLEFAAQSAESYIKDFLVGRFHPHTIIIGYDHRFGHDRTGDFLLMEEFAPKLSYELKEIPQHVVDSLIVSSTRIRQSISDGDVSTANHLLGYEFFFHGRVIHGNKLGRTLGFPTANLELSDRDKLIPGNGVYAVKSAWRGQLIPGMMNIGIRPTLTDGKFMIEVNLFDFDEDIYEEELRVAVMEFMRPEMKFNNLDELKWKIAEDKMNAIAILGC